MLMTPMTPNVMASPMAIEHQHRAEAQAEEQRLDAGVEACAHRSIGCTAVGRGARGPSRPASTKLPSATCLEQRASRLRTSWPELSRERRDRRRGASLASVPSSADERQPGVDFRLDAGVGLDAGALAQQRDARLVERPQHLASPPSRRTAASGLDRSKRATAVLQRRAAAGCSCRSSSVRPRGAEPASSSVSGSTRSSDGSVVVGRLDDERPSDRRCGSRAGRREAP